jgi:cytochrome c oxidase assembly protein subunit 15
MTLTLPGPYVRPIAWWLVVCAAMIFVMVILGGATRLTESGLSMVEWKPLTVMPPMNEAQWQSEFQGYQQSPEFLKKNSWMTVADFKGIYWLEFIHRLWGRLIGIVFAAPFAWFLYKRAVDRPLALKLVGLFALGGAQGALGWFMVASGLQDRPDVSQYRLAAHLILAFVVYGLILWVALDLFRITRHTTGPVNSDSRFARLTLGVTTAVLLVTISGAFVAGGNAGLIYNTFPLMDGQLIPDGLYGPQPWYIALFEDVLTVQFNHRVLAVSLVILIAATCWHARAIDLGIRARALVNRLLVMALLQAVLGISTLLMVVPIGLALAHQAGALILFTIALCLAYEVRTSAAAPAAARLHINPAE